MIWCGEGKKKKKHKYLINEKSQSSIFNLIHRQGQVRVIQPFPFNWLTWILPLSDFLIFKNIYSLNVYLLSTCSIYLHPNDVVFDYYNNNPNRVKRPNLIYVFLKMWQKNGQMKRQSNNLKNNICKNSHAQCRNLWKLWVLHFEYLVIFCLSISFMCFQLSTTLLYFGLLFYYNFILFSKSTFFAFFFVGWVESYTRICGVRKIFY